ncbi:MAG: RimK family protein [Verrucomicrobiaceae bacterium]
MPTHLIVVDRIDDWPEATPDARIISASEYLKDDSLAALRRARVYNLCHSYRYQSTGYYVSLLAEARGHLPCPSITTIQDLKFQSLARSLSGGLQDLITRSLATLKSDRFTLSVYFAKNLAKRYDTLSRKLASRFPSPFIRATFKRTRGIWRMAEISAITTADVPPGHWPFIHRAASLYFRQPEKSRHAKTPRFTLAILVDPSEKNAPSNERGLKRFGSAAARAGIRTELITKADYSRLPHFDGLFIRTTTSVNHFSYRFARSAEAFGMTVIDSSTSIVRCANKVYLAELLRGHKITTPRTAILHRENLDEVLADIGLPMILKLPDSAFSLGVKKAASPAEFETLTLEMLKQSDLLVAQEYLPTDFDWRIGILDQRPFFACKYFMARGHWQIYNNDSPSSRSKEGGFRCIPLDQVPPHVINTALRATSVIGDSLYGVDIKEIGTNAIVIEVNDNPNLDADIEDKLLRRSLWDQLAKTFLSRLESR